MDSTTLVDFVLARIAEDETVAARAIDHHPIGHHWDEGNSEDAEYFARWNPWRILNLCTIRRRILSAHRAVTRPTGEVACVACNPHTSQANWPCDTIRLLVLDWVEHPDFREHWVR